MIAVVIMLAAITATSIGGLIYFARLAVVHADARATLEREAATARGDSAVDALKVDQANAAVSEIDSARKAAQDRQHEAEKALGDAAVAATSGDGDDLLRASLEVSPATSSGTAESDHGNGGVSLGSAGRSPAPR